MKTAPLNIVFFPHSVNYGLAGTNRLQNIIYFLKKSGHHSIANLALEDKAKLFERKENELFISAYKEIYYGPSLKNFISHIFITAYYLYKFRKKETNNIIFFYGEIDIKNFFFIKWARLIGYKVVIDIVEDLEAVTKFKSFKNKLKYKSAIFFRRRLDAYADGFIVVSSHLEKKIAAAFPAKPIFFLPVTVNKFLLSGNKVPSTGRPLTIFYSGSFNEKDGLPYLLEALGNLKRDGKVFKIVLSGKGSDREMEKFWQDATRYDLVRFIDYKGFLSRSEYTAVLSNEADILCMTRVNSAYANAGFPFKLGEFLATGKPVIASKVGDVEKYLTPGDAYLVDPESSRQIGQAISEIMENKDKAVARGLNGQKAAMRHFDHENYAGGLSEFIENLAIKDYQ